MSLTFLVLCVLNDHVVSGEGYDFMNRPSRLDDILPGIRFTYMLDDLPWLHWFQALL